MVEIFGVNYTLESYTGEDGYGHTQIMPAAGDFAAEVLFPDRTFSVLSKVYDMAYQAVNGGGADMVATSATSNTVGTGAKTFTVQTGKAFVAGQRLLVARTSAPHTTQMIGAVTSYNSGTGSLVVEVDTIAGTGTHTDWTISNKGGAVDGPASSTDYALCAFNGTTGKLIRQLASWLADASDNISAGDKILKRAIFQDCAEKVQAVTAVTNTSIDLTLGNVIELTHGVDVSSLTLSNPSPTGNACWVHIIRTKDNSGTARAIAHPSGITWSGGTAPILTQTATAVDIWSYLTLNAGSTWRGFVGGLAFA